MSNYGLDVLEVDECSALLHTQRVGRMALVDEDPAVLPVVYALLDGDIVFRTAPGAKLVAAVLGREVVFEVDHFDADARTGWSVNVIGNAAEIVHPAELERARALGLHPWAGDARDRFVRVTPERITGRRIRGTAPGA
jgi:uncharacterized protein